MQLLSSDPQQRPSCEDILALPFLQPYVSAAQQLVSELRGQQLVAQQVAATQAAAAVTGSAATPRHRASVAAAGTGVSSRVRSRASPAGSFTRGDTPELSYVATYHASVAEPAHA